MKTQLDLRMGASKGYDSYVKGLFAAGEKGAWYDPSDFSTMFQNVAGTTPVTAAGQPVGKILDKSGNGFHMVAPADTTVRPTLMQDSAGKYYLDADGVDDKLSCASFNMNSAKMTVFAGVVVEVAAAFDILLELSAALGTNTGVFSVTASLATAINRLTYSSRGTATATAYQEPITLNQKYQLVAQGKVTNTALANIQLGGITPIAAATSTANQSGTVYGNHTLFMFTRNNNNLPFNGRVYAMVIRGAASSAAEILNIRAYLRSKMGV